MKFNKVKPETMAEAAKLIDEATDKSNAILEATNMLIEEQYDDLILQVIAESKNSQAKNDLDKKTGVRSLTKEEEEFYNLLKTDPKQAITAKQIDIIPTSIIDYTLADVREKSELLSLATFAPADVKKWIVASKTGKYAWGTYDSKITGELSAEIKTLYIELGKLTAYLVIPKAIRELANPFVDKYFTAILNETMNDGLEHAFLKGDGANGPVGVFMQVKGVTGTAHAAKTKNTELTNFSPKALAEAKKQLTHDGTRAITGLALVCNPADEVEFVDPCLYGPAVTGAYIQVSKDKIKVISTPNCPKGEAGLLINTPKYYTMGISGVRVNDYDQAKALDDADLIIAKCYANGRAVDDDVCFYFDPTKLVEYVPTIRTVTDAAGV